MTAIPKALVEAACDALACVQYIKASPYRVDCKCCGRKIVTIDKTAEYAEIMIYFKDGSRHHTCLCKVCARTKNRQLLQAIHTADMLRLEEIGMNVSNLCAREVVGSERIL